MKAVGAILIVVALAATALWVAHGADLATREKVPVTTKSVDDFGDEVETITWKAPTDFPLTGFHVGLDRAGPIVGLSGVAGICLIVFGVRRSRRESSNDG